MPIAMFYNSPRPLDVARDASLKVRSLADLGFARNHNTITINMSEFPLVARHYPIGFVGDDAFPAAIVGLHTKNLFLDAEGRWKAGAYIPAAVRRYPFMFADTDTKNNYKLCVDDVPEAVSLVEGRPLFEESGQLSAVTQQAMEFCRNFHTGGEATEKFVKAIKDAGLLVSRQAETQLSTGRRFTLTGFKSVDPLKLRKLPAKTLALWNERNWLAPIFAHLQSMTNWNDLMALVDPAEMDPPQGQAVR